MTNPRAAGARPAGSSPLEGYRAIPELLHRGGLDVVFSMLGGTNVPWIAEGVRAGTLRLVRTRHEETAVSAACGYGRSTGRVGLCSVTRGPGFTNAITALVAAARGNVPLVLIVGESPTTTVRSAQNIDQRGLCQLIGAGFHHVARIDDLESVFWTALTAARQRSAPQVLSLANGVLEARTTLSDEPARVLARAVSAPAPLAVRAAVDALEGSHRPLVLAGAGAVDADCRAEIERLAELCGARLTTTLRALRFFSGHPSDLGLCGGWSPDIVRRHLSEADVVLVIGASMNSHTTDRGTVFPRATIVHCEIDPDQPSAATRPELALTADAKETASALIAEWQRRGLPRRPAPTPGPSEAEIRASALAIDLGHDPDRGLDPRDVFVALDDALPKDRLVVTDTGRWLGTMPSLVRANDARSWLVGNSFGTVGLGLGTAIGVAAAHPERPVVLFCGDGGFMLATQGLDAIPLNGLRLTIAIMNDERYGSEVKYLDQFALPKDVITQPLPDIPMLAAAFGGRGVVIRDRAALESFRSDGSPLTILDLRLDPEVNVRTVIAGWSSRSVPEGRRAASDDG